MSNFVNGFNNEEFMNLAENLADKYGQLKKADVTYDPNTNTYRFSKKGSDSSLIELYSTKDLLNYYFGDNWESMLDNNEIFIVSNNLGIDIIMYGGRVIGYGAGSKKSFKDAFVEGAKEFVIEVASEYLSGKIDENLGIPEDITNAIKAAVELWFDLEDASNENGMNPIKYAEAFADIVEIEDYFMSYYFSNALNYYIESWDDYINSNFFYNIWFNGGFLDIEDTGGGDGVYKDYFEWLKKHGSDEIDFTSDTLDIPVDEDRFKKVFDDYIEDNSPNKKDDVTADAGIWSDDDIIDDEVIADIIEKTKAIEHKDVSDRINNVVRDVVNNVTNASQNKCDPLIFDLGGDGFNIESKKDGTNFDLDTNGFAERINWTKKDGFLCLDLNENGVIDNGGELFGDQTLLADGTRAKNGFEALAQYDSNGDGVIDENDEIFDKLRIWVDANGDGISDEGEMMTLRELGITSISLNYETIEVDTGTEATIGHSATFTREDGTTGGVGELWVSSDLYDTVDKVDVEIPDDIKTLPDVRSIGNVYSLHTAMALDETGELKALVESFAAENDMDKRIELAEKILYFICGANNVKDGSRGLYMDAKQLAVLEAMLGEKYVGTNGANPNSVAAPMLKKSYQNLLNMYYCELNIQTHIKDYAALLRYTENEDGSRTLNAALLNYILEYKLANGDEDAKQLLADISRYIQYLDNGGINGLNAFVVEYASLSYEYAVIIANTMPDGYIANGKSQLDGTGSSDLLVGSDNAETIKASTGNDILIGGKGNDTLYGGKGNDTYVFNLGDGNDIINEDSLDSGDKIVFGEGISAEDIVISRSGDDMIIRYSENDSVKILGQYGNSRYQVEEYYFADGTVLTVDDLLNTSLTITGSGTIYDFTSGYGTRSSTLIGSDGADKIYGYDGNDTLIGGKGNDTLYGGAGNDTYIFNLGDGNDIINEDSLNSDDKIVFGEGISAEDIVISRSGDDMIIRYSKNDSVKILGQYSNNRYQVEEYYFADGTVLTVDDLLNTSLTITGSGTIRDFTSGYGKRGSTLIGSDGADNIYGYDGNDTLIGGKGNDTLYGGAGNDTYIFNLGDGNDIINEDSLNSDDKIVFGEGISAEDIVISRSGSDMIIRYSENDSVKILGQYSNTRYQVEEYYFADGTVLTVDDLLNTSPTITGSGTIHDFTTGYGKRGSILIGSDGADNIYGYDGNDTLIGGKGDDFLYGGKDNDTYIFNLGDGNDVIEDYYASSTNSKEDKVVFGDGISAENIIFRKSGNNLVISYTLSDDSIKINNQYISYYTIENFETSDGYSISSSKIDLLIQAMASFEADTGMSWTEAVEQGNETVNDIISQMWVKSAP